jgi:hypothetical protein
MTSSDTTAPDPDLHWTVIADHARTQHGARWATDHDAITAIIGAFDGILPAGYGYHPVTGIGHVPHLPAGQHPAWEDPDMLTCVIARLATGPDCCPLQTLAGTENLLADWAEAHPPPAIPDDDQPPG